MAIAIDTSASLGNVTDTSLTAAYTTSGSNRILFVAAFDFTTSGNQITGVTYNGVALTQIESAQDDGSDQFVSFWYLVAPATGSNNIVISASSSVLIYGIAASYTGVDQLTPINVSGVATTASAASISKSLTTTVDNTWTVAAVMAPSGTYSAGAGTFLRQANASNTVIVDSNSAITPAGSTSLTANISPNATNAMIMAAFNPVGAGTTTSTSTTSTSSSTSTSTSTSTTSTSSSTSTTSTSTSISTSTSRSTSSSTSTTSTSSSTSTTTSTSTSTSTSTTTSTSTSTSTSTTSTSTSTTWPYLFDIDGSDSGETEEMQIAVDFGV